MAFKVRLAFIWRFCITQQSTVRYLFHAIGLMSIIPFAETLQAQSTRPNILWIIADDLNDYVWADDERTENTPILATLAQNGARFNACYANSPLCCPSRASFMTGKSPEWT